MKNVSLASDLQISVKAKSAWLACLLEEKEMYTAPQVSERLK